MTQHPRLHRKPLSTYAVKLPNRVRVCESVRMCVCVPFCLNRTAILSSVLELMYIRTAGALEVLKLKATSSRVRFTPSTLGWWCTVFASLLAPATASGRKLYLTSVPASKKPPISGHNQPSNEKKLTNNATEGQKGIKILTIIVCFHHSAKEEEEDHY